MELSEYLGGIYPKFISEEDLKKIKRSPRTFFKDKTLLSLDLSGIHLPVIQKNFFEKLTDLETLILANNDIEYIPEGSFQSCGKLQTLDISNNPIYSLHKNALVGLENIKHINLSHTLIYQFDNNQEFPENLESLNLRSTLINDLLEGDNLRDFIVRVQSNKMNFMRKVPAKQYFWNTLKFTYLGLGFLLVNPLLGGVNLGYLSLSLILFAFFVGLDLREI